MRQVNNDELDDIELGKLEKEFERFSPRLTDRELLNIFPEAKSYLKYRLKELEKEIQTLIPEIKEDLRNIYENIKDEFAVWFNEEIVRVWKGDCLNELDKKISRLKLLLNPDKKSSGRIADSTIERAEQYPFEDLIQVKNNFAHCPFHDDKRPSFYIKNNRGRCFGCGWYGNTINFVMNKYNLSFQEAIKYLT